MNKYIENRILEESNYIIKTQNTIRETAKNFNVSKSTVHKDVSYRLIAFFSTCVIFDGQHIKIRGL